MKDHKVNYGNAPSNGLVSVILATPAIAVSIDLHVGLFTVLTYVACEGFGFPTTDCEAGV